MIQINTSMIDLSMIDHIMAAFFFNGPGRPGPAGPGPAGEFADLGQIMTDQSQSWKIRSADPPRPANSTNPFFDDRPGPVCYAVEKERLGLARAQRWKYQWA